MMLKLFNKKLLGVLVVLSGLFLIIPSSVLAMYPIKGKIVIKDTNIQLPLAGEDAPKVCWTNINKESKHGNQNPHTRCTDEADGYWTSDDTHGPHFVFDSRDTNFGCGQEEHRITAYSDVYPGTFSVVNLDVLYDGIILETNDGPDFWVTIIYTPPPVPPNGELSAACDPTTQDYISDLEQAGPVYGLKLSAITPVENFARATFALCFNNSDPINQSSALKTYLGAPDSCEGNTCDTGWFCWNIAYPPTLVNTNEIYFKWDRSHTGFANKYGNGKTINQLADKTQAWIDAEEFPKGYKYHLYSNMSAKEGKDNDHIDGNGLPLDLTPNACAESIAPTCNAISMLDSDGTTPIDDDTPLSPGQTIKFQCSANPADAAVYYQFNIAKHNPTTGVYSSIINSPTDISSSIISSDITIDSTGDYYAQCRICTDATDEASCQDWEQTPLPPGCKPVASNMSCDDNAVCIACYGQPVSCDDTEDGKRCQIPTGGFDLD